MQSLNLCSQLVDQHGVMVAVEVDVLQQPLLAHLQVTYNYTECEHNRSIGYPMRRDEAKKLQQPLLIHLHLHEPV